MGCERYLSTRPLCTLWTPFRWYRRSPKYICHVLLTSLLTTFALCVIPAHAQKELKQQLNWLRQKEAQLREEKLLLLIKDVSEQPGLQTPGTCTPGCVGCRGRIGEELRSRRMCVPRMYLLVGVMACHTSLPACPQAPHAPLTLLILAY